MLLENILWVFYLETWLCTQFFFWTTPLLLCLVSCPGKKYSYCEMICLGENVDIFIARMKLTAGRQSSTWMFWENHLVFHGMAAWISSGYSTRHHALKDPMRNSNSFQFDLEFSFQWKKRQSIFLTMSHTSIPSPNSLYSWASNWRTTHWPCHFPLPFVLS